MVSPQIIRRFPFFSGISYDNVVAIANISKEITAEAGEYFFHESQEIDHLYLVSTGLVGIVISVPMHNVQHTVSEQLMREFATEDAILTTVGPGRVFGWTGMVPDYITTAGAKALSPCQVIAIDCIKLRELFDADCQFALIMTQKIAQVMRSRLRDSRIESLGTDNLIPT
jgi:CRP-like cAMP-binding protein